MPRCSFVALSRVPISSPEAELSHVGVGVDPTHKLRAMVKPNLDGVLDQGAPGIGGKRSYESRSGRVGGVRVDAVPASHNRWIRSTA